MKEKILIVVIALVVGLTIATVGFYIFKTTKNIPQDVNNKIASIKSPQLKPTIQQSALEISEPKDESVTDKRTIVIKGKTVPNNTVIVSSSTDDVVQPATATGDFSISASIDSGTNLVSIRSIGSNGEEIKKDITITFYNQEDL